MAFEELWQNETWRKAFQRWWDEDWSWGGLENRRKQSSLTPPDEELDGSLQDVWSDERDHLIDFGGRRWTRFHLPPFGCDGIPCPPGLWAAAKDEVCCAALSERLERKNLRVFTEFADLRGVVFPPNFGWAREVLQAAFDSAIFLGDYVYHQPVIATFEQAIFSRFANFDGATFSENAQFDGATFSGNSVFNRTTFSRDARFYGTTFLMGAGFYGATFSGFAGFDGATFSRFARFYGVSFSGKVRFDGATFSDEVRFDRATFAKGVTFSGTDSFKKSVSFQAVSFSRGCDFSNRTFQDRVDFSGATFGGVPKFHGVKLHPDTSFLNTQFRDGRKGRDLPRCHRQWFGDWPTSDEKDKPDYNIKRKACKRRLRIYRYVKNVPFGLRCPGLRDVRRQHDSDAEKYEIAYRCLRRLAGDIGSIEYEGLFHGLELRAHRARTDTQMMARIASWCYEMISDYGRSLSRPLCWLFGMWLAFSVGYSAWLWLLFRGNLESTCKWLGPAGSAKIPAPDIQGLLGTVAREFLPGFFGLSAAASRPPWLRCAEAYNEIGYIAITLVQNIIFLACVSLFLIALRRRFQLRE